MPQATPAKDTISAARVFVSSGRTQEGHRAFDGGRLTSDVGASSRPSRSASWSLTVGHLALADPRDPFTGESNSWMTFWGAHLGYRVRLMKGCRLI